MMSEPDFEAGQIHTQWLDIHLAQALNRRPRIPDALLALAVYHHMSAAQPPSALNEATAWETTARMEGLRS
jgi:hypothetical protein